MSPRFSRKYFWMTPLTISLDKFTRITSYPNLAPNFFLSVVSATSLKTQSSVSMATSTKKLTDAVWETLYLQSSQISSWQNWNPTLSDPLTHRFATGMLMIVLPKRKKDKPDDLLECLNSYHPNIVFTVEENPRHFSSSTAKSTRNQENYQRIGNQKSLPNAKEMVLLVPSTEGNAFLLILTTISKQFKQPF